jgi:hypothetical protein
VKGAKGSRGPKVNSGELGSNKTRKDIIHDLTRPGSITVTCTSCHGLLGLLGLLGFIRVIRVTVGQAAHLAMGGFCCVTTV